MAISVAGETNHAADRTIRQHRKGPVDLSNLTTMPGLTISTDAAASRPGAARAGNTPAPQSQSQSQSHSQRRSGTSSPTKPPVSPITPPLRPAQLHGPSDGAGQPAVPPFVQSRPTFTHSQPDQVGVAVPVPEPIAFDSNPDVLALRSAVTILQLQRQRALADIQRLSAAKDAALDRPAEFVHDLAEGRVRHGGDGLFPARDDDDDEDEDGEDAGEDLAATAGGGKDESKDKAWATLPGPQNVVRTPPINWAQYAVVGDSLDKLHAEQVARPAQGTPAVMGPGGTFAFTAEPPREGGGEQRRLVGVAAPYTPGRDKLEKKPRGSKR